MIKLSELQLSNYPKLMAYLQSKTKIESTTPKDPFKYQFSFVLEDNINVSDDNVTESTHLSLVEICTLLGLNSHLASLRKQKGFHQHLREKENKALLYCIENGSLEVLKQLEVVLTMDELKDSFHQNNDLLIKRMIICNHLHLFTHFCAKLTNVEFIDLFEAKNYEVLRLVTENKLIDFLLFLEKDIPKKEINKAIQIYNYEPYQVAAKLGSFELIDFFEKCLSDIEIIHAIKAQSYEAYRIASNQGHLKLLEHFEAKLSELDVITAIKEHSFENFCLAAENSHHDAIKAIKARNFESIRFSAQNGQLKTLKYMISKLSRDDMINAIEVRNFEAFRLAAKHGHLHILEFIEALSSKLGLNIIDAIKADKYDSFTFAAFRFDAFRVASKNGHLALLKYFEEKFLNSGLDICEAIAAYSYEPFRLAASEGHVVILEHFKEKLHQSNVSVKEAIKANDYYAYQYAAANGALETVTYLESLLAFNEIVEAIRSRKFYAYCYAIRNGHINTVAHLEQNLADAKILPADIIKQDKFKCFRYAAFKNHQNTVQHCLYFDAVFAHAEIRVAEYGRKYVYPFVMSLLSALTKRKEAFSATQPNESFNIKNTEAQLFFYVIRHLIRLNTEKDARLLAHLLPLRSVSMLLHEDMSGDGENELLRLALRIGNKKAVDVLIKVPSVISLAEENNFYETSWGPYGALDLRELICDLNASTQQISQDEQRMVDLFNEKYKEQTDNPEQLKAILDELLNHLINLYKADPAIIDTEIKKDIKLPLKWDEFRNLYKKNEGIPGFSKLAIEAYFNNTVHTVIRCLTQEKSWLSEKNKYMPEGKVYTEHWSTLEAYRATLAHLYLAASERKTGKVGNELIRQRLQLFLKLYTSLCGIDYI